MAEIKAERPVGHLLAGFRQWCCSLLVLASLDFNGASEQPSKAATPSLILQKTGKWVAKSGLLQPYS